MDSRSSFSHAIFSSSQAARASTRSSESSKDSVLPSLPRRDFFAMESRSAPT